MPNENPDKVMTGVPRRRVLRAVAKGTLGAGLALPFLGRGAQAAVTLTLFSQQTNQASAVVRGLRRMSDMVRDRTEGALLINVRTAGLLPIDANQVLDAVAAGKIDLGDDANHAVTVAPAAVMRLPLLATTPEEWDRVAAVVRPTLTAELEQRGMVLLTHYRSAMQMFWSRQKATGFADITRQRLRVQSLEQGEFVRHYAGLHLMTSTVEAAEAFAAGKLQGTFGTAFGVGRMWKAWLKHVYLAGPNYNDAVIVVRRDALEGLPERGQQALLASAADATGWIARTQDEEEQRLMATLRGEGLRTTPTNTDEVQEGTAKLPTYWDSWVRLRPRETGDLLARIRQVLDR